MVIADGVEGYAVLKFEGVVGDELQRRAVGDYVLKELAVILRQSVRESDVVARTGGEEFSVILPKAGPEEAATFAERIRQHVYDRQFLVYGKDIHITTSIGSACFPADAEISEPEMLAYFADQALLLAKESGRDCVIAVADIDMAIRQRFRRHYMSMQSAQQSHIKVINRL